MSHFFFRQFFNYVLINMTSLCEWEELTVHMLVVLGSSHMTNVCMRSKSVIEKAIRDSLIDSNSVNNEEDDIALTMWTNH